MPSRPRFLSFDVVVFVVVFLALMALGPSSLLRDPGIFWHLRAGDQMLATGSLIRTDNFSSTFAGQPWLAHAWLFECLQSLLQRIDGFDTLLLATAASLAALWAWIARRLLRAGFPPVVTAFLVALGIAAGAYQFLPRPMIVSFALTGVLYAMLCDFEAARIPDRRLLWLLPVFVVWTNVHGAVIGGLATLALAAVGWVLAPLVGWPTPLGNLRRTLAMALFSAACCACVLVNPYGVGLVKQWFAVVGSPVIARLMVEHAPASISDPSSWNLFALGLLYAAALLGVPFRRWRVSWLLPVVWLVMACSRIRHGPLFAVMATLGLAEMAAEIRWLRWLAARGSELAQLRPEGAGQLTPAAKAIVLPSLLVGFSLLLQAVQLPLPLLGHGRATLDPEWWPVDLLPELQAYEASAAPGTTIFNEMLFGGFLIEYTPRLGVFIDDRCELYGDARLAEYERVLDGDGAPFEAWTQRYHFRLAITVRGSAFDELLRRTPGWTLEKETRAATLFRRSAA